MVTGLTAYFFESRGQYDKAEYFWKKYEEDIAMGIKTSNERDMAPIKRENNHFAQFQ